MPIKKDGTGKRWVELDLLVHGTPEQVWQAMATGAGYTAWFTRTTIEERVGGKLVFDFGGGATSSGEVLAWQPPFHFGYVEREWSEGAPPVATEVTITARSGDTCVVRMVHSLFASSDDWDDQMEGFENGWPGFFDVLRVYLRHFIGQRAASTSVMASTEGDVPAAWKRATTRLALAGTDVGDRRSTPDTPQRLSGVVEAVHQSAAHRYVVLRLDAPAPGIAVVGAYDHGGTATIGLSLYYYGEGADAAAATSESCWRETLAGLVT